MLMKKIICLLILMGLFNICEAKSKNTILIINFLDSERTVSLIGKDLNDLKVLSGNSIFTEKK